MSEIQRKIRIRKAELEDAQTLSYIGIATFLESYTELIDGPAMITHCANQHSVDVYTTYLNDPKNDCWLAEYEPTGAPIGYAVNSVPDLPIEILDGDVELKRIYALSRYHGSGVGLSLMKASIERAAAKGAPRLLLGTYEENFRAMAFYGKHGFETIGRRAFNVGGTIYDDIVMAKSLN